MPFITTDDLETNKHASAFPNFQTDETFGDEPGLTKREWFAGMALQGILASSYGGYDLVKIVEFSVQNADALLKALEE